ncbi:carnosine synthase 1 [Bufo bufo]|uniref:carnosine synthase 1 n=1 Tax=Bufo bufo TaxID=8384 RepID=UPI001ABE40DD|nr:carnosine synthase 1 [Bufo bufo]XP_040290572.1 carnosine synthase 1 [Bufo bufo]
MLSLDQLILDHPMYSKDGELSEVWVSGVTPDGPPWGMRTSTETPQGKTNGYNEMQQHENIIESYEDLQKVLINAGLPETEDRSKQPRTGHTMDTTTICVFGAPSFAMSILLEGARQCPGKILLCLSTSWFCPAPPSPATTVPLFIKQAVTFDLGGRTYLDTFSPPRRVTYLSWLGGPQFLMGEQWDCPIGGSPQLSLLLANTLGVRILLDTKGLPLTPSLLLSNSYQLGSWGKCTMKAKSTRVVELCQKGQEETIRQEISAFLSSLKMKGYQKVVLKTFWPYPGRSPSTSFYSSQDTLQVSNVVVGFFSELPLGQAVLLEGFVMTVPPCRIKPSPPPACIPRCSVRPPELTIRLCAVVCRSRGDQPILSKVVCMVGRAEKPLCHRFTLPQSLDTTLELWGVLNETQKREIMVQIKDAAEKAMKAIMEEEKKMNDKERGGNKVQTDILGVDMLLTYVDYMVSPVILGVTTDLCLESCGIHESVLGSLAAGKSTSVGSASGLLIETMLRRSMMYVMEGKEVLVIGAGGISKNFIWEVARNYGIKIHLVDSNPGHFASSLVTSFIHYNYEDRSCDDEEHAQNILSTVREKGLHFSGCMTFWDECTILAAIMCQMLGLAGPPPNAVRLAKRKTQTQLRLLNMTAPSPPFPYAGAFAVPCFPLGPGTGGVEAAESVLSYPLVLKPESGAGAVGVRLIQDAEECRRLVKKMGVEPESCNLLNNDGHSTIDAGGVCHKEEVCKPRNVGRYEPEVPEVGLSNGVSSIDPTEPIKAAIQTPPPLLAEYITGSEHDVDLVMGFNGRLLAAYVSDNGPTLLPGFTETAAALPSRLSQERCCHLVQAASRSCRALGLYPGVFNVELKMTDSGPRLLEINPRMGGFYLRDWIHHIYGTDLVLVALALSCGLEPGLPEKGAQENGVLVGVMCTGESHEEALRTTANPQRFSELHNSGYIRFNRMEGSPVHRPDQEPYGNVACQGKSQKEARERLLGVCSVLGLDSQGYPLHYLTGEFQ